ncbi:MAG TPA: glycosyl hydrolase family 18 protein [Candidatus Limnocylindria bacterium]|nr:glycosyl hydrolase family 18 protein [Candidatus Limnocylindria bacterium]
MTEPRRQPRRAAHRATVVGVAFLVLASILPASATAVDLHPGSIPVAVLDARVGEQLGLATALPDATTPPDATASPRAGAPPHSDEPATTEPATTEPQPELLPSIHYRQDAEHAGRRFEFEPGDAVTVPFTPRAGDRWEVDGNAARPLPAGHATGRQMRDAPPGEAWANGRPSDLAIDRHAAGAPGSSDDAAAGAEPASFALDPATGAGVGDVAAAPVGPSGLRREVFGFLPYWEIGDSSTTLDWRTLSTVAYFSVGCNSNGSLQKRNPDGSTSTGWAGWTSSKMTSIINAAHQNHTRVVLTVTCMAWTSSGAGIQAALLRSSTARATLAKQIAAAVRDRGADGANLDFEPIVAGYADEFTALVRRIRTELNNVAPGYQLTFDTLGSIGNQPVAAATAPGGADAVFVMAYDYRTAGSTYAGSHSPLTGPIYDLNDTLRVYLAKIPASKLILGMPYYGRAWSTSSSTLHAKNISGTKYGGSAEPSYAQAVDIVAAYGRRWDSVEQAPWTAYRKQTCSTQYGCVSAWRQLYYDDAASLKLRYDLVNRKGLRGAGIWALGYDNARPELRNALAEKFLSDRTAPVVGITRLGESQRDEGFRVSWTAYDDSTITGYDVDVSVNGGAWARWLGNATVTSSIYLGTNGRTYAFRIRARDIHGNLSAWNSAINLGALGVPAEIVPGGFARVVAVGLRMRTSPSTGAAVMTTLAAGDALRVIGGPVSGEGYTWFQVAGPVRQWGPVDAMQVGGWVAAHGNGVENAAPRRPVYATRISAGITGLKLNNGGERALTPNGDGKQDVLHLAWTNHGSFESLALRVHRADGTLVGAVGLGGTGAGVHTSNWNGRIGGALVPPGVYVVQIQGRRGATAYSAPSGSPVSPTQVARFGVVVGPVAPTAVVSFKSSPASPTRSGNLAFTLQFGGSVKWLLPGDIVRSGTATGCSMGKPSGSGARWSISVSGCSAGTVTMTLKARSVMDVVSNWGPQANVSTTVRIDRSPPLSTGPKVSLRSGVALASILPSTAVFANVAWSATDPGGAGIRDFDVRRSTDGGAFQDVAIHTTATSMPIGLSPSHSYRFQVRARDRAGNLGGWVAGPAFRAARVQGPSTAIAYRGAWATGTSAHYSGGTVRFSTAAGASARYSFTGRGIALTATRGPDRGAVKVYLDGVLVSTVDTRAASMQFRQVIFSKTWASKGAHTIRLVVVGTSGRPRFDLDSFEVLR